MKLTLTGLSIASAQVFGQIRLVPLIRTTPMADLRLSLVDYGTPEPDEADVTVQTVTGTRRRTAYTAYVPHGLIVDWDPDDHGVAAFDTLLGRGAGRRRGGCLGRTRIVQRRGRHRLRLLPQHVAMEGFLASHFGGPDVALQCWTRGALTAGLSPRSESGVSGARIPGLAEALRLFEVHAGQCGVLVFVADGLASATVVSHPDDYLALHHGLITDVYSEMLQHWGWSYRESPEAPIVIAADRIGSLADLGHAVADQRRQWSDYVAEQAEGLFGRQVVPEVLRRAGRYRLVRFCTGLEARAVGRAGEHLGEALVDDDDRLAYLKTYRLDRAQARRGHMLSQLAASDWDPRAVADAQGHGSLIRVIRDLEVAGLGYLVRDSWRQQILRLPTQDG